MRPCFGVAGLVLFLLAGLPLAAKDQPPTIAPQDRLLVLPVEFAYYKYGMTGPIEVVIDRSEQAQRNLESSLQRALRRDESQLFVPLPQMSVDELAIVNEYTDLLRLLAAASTADILNRAPPTLSVDSIGGGLAFIAERAGVDRAIFVSGFRGIPSADVALMVPFLTTEPLLRIGNKKVLSAIVVDLRSGDLLVNIVPERGFAGEADDVAGANTWMRALFDIAPDRVRGVTMHVRKSRPERPVRHPRPRKGFIVTSPLGWVESDTLHTMCLYRHRAGIENICVDNMALGDALRARGMTPDADPMQIGEVATSVIKADDRFADMAVTSLVPARIAGRNGFRAELTSRLKLGGSHIRERHVVYGMTGGQGAYLLRFDAPAIYYFDRYLGEFEAVVTTFRFL